MKVQILAHSENVTETAFDKLQILELLTACCSNFFELIRMSQDPNACFFSIKYIIRKNVSVYGYTCDNETIIDIIAS